MEGPGFCRYEGTGYSKRYRPETVTRDEPAAGNGPTFSLPYQDSANVRKYLDHAAYKLPWACASYEEAQRRLDEHHEGGGKS